MNADLEKLDFIKTIFEQIPQNSSNEHTRQEVLRFLLAHVQNGRLYKYRACNKNSFSNLKEGTLHCALPSFFNDPFDCQVGIDFNSYISEKFGQELAPIDAFLNKFIQVYDEKIFLSSCTEQEKKVFDKWLRSKNLMLFLDEHRGRDITESELGEVLLNNFHIVIEILLGFMADSELKEQMATSLNMMPGLLKNMSPDGVMRIADENATYEDFARSLGVNEDADEITLTKLMYQSQHPEDALTATKMDEDLARANKEMGQAIDKTFRVGCLCTDYKNRLMWSHYADGHKGFCIEYDFSCETEELLDILILPVVYSSERPKFPWSVALAVDKDANGVKVEGARAMLRSLLTKDNAWCYEDEWRIISLCSTGIENIKMPPVSCIYIGALCNEENKAKLIEIAKDLDVPIKQMVVDRGEYKLHAQPIV